MIKKLEDALASGKTKKIDLMEFMQNCQGIFEECERCLEFDSARGKEDLLKDLMALQETLESDVESLSKETGKTAEQLFAYVENPDNFPQDTWQIMQKTWRFILTIKTKKKKSSTHSKKDNKDPNSGWVKP